MKFTLTTSIAAVAASALLTAAAHASPIDPNLPGNTSYDGWDDLTVSGNPGYPTYPGFGDWPTPIESNLGSGDAGFDKVSGSGFPASGSMYSPNGGVFTVSDSTALDDLASIVFQIDIGEADGVDFDAAPTLSYNGGTQAVLGVQHLVSRFQDGTFTNPETNEEEPIYRNTWSFQWDLTGVADAITSFNIDWSIVAHTQTYALRLDQSDVYAAVPEPASLALLGAGGVLMMRRQRRA